VICVEGESGREEEEGNEGDERKRSNGGGHGDRR